MSWYVFHNMYLKLEPVNVYYDETVKLIMEMNVDRKRGKRGDWKRIIRCDLQKWDSAGVCKDIVRDRVDWGGFRIRVVELKQWSRERGREKKLSILNVWDSWKLETDFNSGNFEL